MNAAVYAEWSAAKAAGVSRYDSTIPCRHGHIGKRFTLDRKCCICNAIKCKQRHDKRVGAAGLIARSKRASRALLRREESAARLARGRKRLMLKSKMARPKGFEPLTPRFVVWCSIQLSYGRFWP